MIRSFADHRAEEVFLSGKSRWFPPEIKRGTSEMSIPNTKERIARPTHPGELLRELYMPDYGLTVASLASALLVSRQTVNDLLREKRALSPEMALRLSKLFGTSAELWTNFQRAVDLWDASRNIRDELDRIQPLNPEGAPSPKH